LAYNTLYDNIYYEANESIPSDYLERIKLYRARYKKAYQDFINELTIVLETKEATQGDVV
jgi:hypothetical protein